MLPLTLVSNVRVIYRFINVQKAGVLAFSAFLYLFKKELFLPYLFFAGEMS